MSRDLSQNTASRLGRLRRLTNWVDIEANALGLKLIREALAVIKPSHADIGMLPYSGMPFNRNLTFFNRPQEIQQLESVLQPGSKTVGLSDLLAISLMGPGGRGKSQLAIEFVHRHSHSYDAVFWFAAESSTTAAGSWATHVRGLGLLDSASTAPTDEQNLAALKQWLGHVSRKG